MDGASDGGNKAEAFIDQLPWTQGEDFWEAPWNALPVPGSESKDRSEDKGKSRTAFEYNPISPSEAHFTGESREPWGNPSSSLTGLTSGKVRDIGCLMQRVLVITNSRKPLMPCHPARARQLLGNGRAKVIRQFPFTICLTERQQGDTQASELKFDPGSKTTGIALVAACKRGRKVLWAAELEHRGQQIKSALDKRRAIRGTRRARKTGFRQARFNNRTRKKGWLPPSTVSRVLGVQTWARRLSAFAFSSEIVVERVKFDMQKMQNQDISGLEYQRGTLFGFEIREFLLQKWNYRCAYCSKDSLPLEIEHILARSKGGSDRLDNLCMACRPCNQKKGNSSVEDFLKSKPKVLQAIHDQLKAPLKDAAAVNATRYKICEILSRILPTRTGTGAQTKFNRQSQGLVKAHWIDAVCVSETGGKVHIPASLKPLKIKATGHGDRQVQLMDKFGFPRGEATQGKIFFGFKTGDIVRAKVPGGKKCGTHIGKVAVRKSGNFNITTKSGVIQGISHKHCSIIHKGDGYAYMH